MGVANVLALTGEAVSLRLAIATIAIGFFIYKYIQRKREWEADKAFGEKHGCMTMETTLPYHWPFALDILKKQYDAIPSQRLLAFQSQYFDKIGPNMRLGLFGQEGYMTTDPKNVEAILSTHFEDWCLGSRRPGLYPLLGEGIFTQDGKPWRHSREILRRQFVRIQYQNLKVFDEHIDDLISGLTAAGDGIVDLQPFFFKFTLATTTDLIFGEPVGTLGSDVQDTFGNNFDYASMVSALRLRLADFEWLYKPKKYREACAVVKQYADHFVAQALKARDEIGKEAAYEEYPFILDLYEDLKDPALVRDHLVHVLIAGRDTTACLMSWAMFLLVRHPEALAKLRSQIISVIPEGQEVTRAHIAKIPFLRCVINETHRLYPQLPVNVRVALRTTLLPSGGGPNSTSPVLIRKGTGVGWSTYHMHRMTSLYGSSANDFIPERWDPEHDLEKKVGWGFMPFHGGPRLCLGKDFALSEASLCLVKILMKFPGVRLPDGVQKEETGMERQSLTIVVTSAEGCKVLLR
ncbi:related to cytochrome P450 CYP4/CYP19/CYP26 subfamilies [Phialocephala subalpina]|uniref:Related to cytochrome P450 CYP4/CYP19/CYP26 subfamilies n=1 Tax=Phialocephala subalpina TaxID=576137 RepID=A0A1L7XK37_9HELO|nr:related to cytochrome P450 CYP4/CYP19/CYP26 subfamilies [Phialocephala subalpina]